MIKYTKNPLRLMGEDLICQALTRICSDTLYLESSKAYILQWYTLKILEEGFFIYSVAVYNVNKALQYSTLLEISLTHRRS